MQETRPSAFHINKNPDWTSDELILALDLYMRVYSSSSKIKNKEIKLLSKILNSLPIHPNAGRGKKFRNENGVAMKLSNFVPSHQ